MRNQIKKILFEEIKNGKVHCENCGWSWKLSDGGDDLYTCHKCGFDNTPKSSNLERVFKKFENRFPDEHKNKISKIIKFVEKYIKQTGYNVKFLNACTAYSGVRTKDQVIICSPNQMATLGDFIYTVFHEIRHEQQISEIKMPNPLSEFDLDDFETLYDQYWEMELDADQFAKNMVASLVLKFDIPLDNAKQIFGLSEFIKQYPQQSLAIKSSLKNVIKTIKDIKSKGIEYSDIQDHPMVKPFLSKLENLI